MGTQPFKVQRKLKKREKDVITAFLTGEIGITEAASRLDITKQRLYTLHTIIMREAVMSASVEVEDLLLNS